MAVDFLLLQRFPHVDVPRFRHYEWRAPAFTFGYSQKIAAVRAALPPEGTFDLCRRPTGGGIVDHRHDWTYALVIPRGHPLEDVRATQSYREVHEALANALRVQGVSWVLQARPDETVDVPTATPAKVGVCFQRAEIYDVVQAHGGAKIAGAAQKRNKRGLLFQGSIWRPAAGAAVDWEKFHEDFTANRAAMLETTAEPVPWPELNEDEVAGLTEQYSAPEWLECR
jgi:lipoate-protein ligase A